MAKTVGTRQSYLATLDGWRALAIVAVIFRHSNLVKIGHFSTKWLYQYGEKGVDVFFAISGILICSRLLEEEEILGRISLKKFYIRRAFRILPAAMLYLSVIGILGLLGLIVVHRGEWLAAVFFYRNYTRFFATGENSGMWFTGHFWSLAVEEHFYLVLPAILAFVSRRFRIPVILTLATIAMLNRAIELHVRPWLLIGFHTDIRLDSLLIPAALAVFAQQAKVRVKLQKWLKIWPLLLVLLLYVLPLGEGTFTQSSGFVFLMPLIVMGSVLNPHGFLGWIFELSPIRYVGKISYSLYLWQQLFFTEHYYYSRPLGALESWPLNVLVTFVCAIASYHILERPMTGIGHRLAPPATPGRNEIQNNVAESAVV